MADVNLNINAPAKQAPAMAPPTRIDDQILPRNRWVSVGKSNCYLDVEKSQSNPIYKIAMEILKHTNFFKAFIASSTIPSIYIQQFWDTIRYDRDTARYICQLDEQWFDLTKDTLRDALQITLVNNNNPFSSSPTHDALINFVNNLERMREEFTQSIHSFVEDKKNLALHTQGKKKANPIVIPSIRFTKLIIHHLQSKHKFHLRPDSPLHLPYEEYILGYLKFSAKGTKREKVAKHQRYLAGEEGSDPDSPAPKPVKATKKSKPSAPKASPVTKPFVFKASESTSSQQPKPKPAPAKTQEKKCKLVAETSDEPSPAKISKPGKVTKRRKPTSSLSLVDEFVDKGIPEKEPRFDDEEADMQRAVEESLKSVHNAHRGPLPPVVIREPDSGKFQLLLEEVFPVVKVGAQDEGQARPNPGVLIEGQDGSNPGDDAEPQPQSSPVVHAGPNLEHMDLKATDVSTQQNPEQTDEMFTTIAYPNIQENPKLTVDEHVILKEPASSIGTLSSL
nr:hypothetical protein [Tanacetum cinerariifolium]